MKNFPSEMRKRISEADADRLNGYIDTFDRLLLYNLAASSMPSEFIDELISKWAQAIKSTIGMEAVARTHFLESTPQGRLAKKQEQPDGEALRLLYLDTLDTAKEIITRNLQRNEDEIDDDDGDDFESTLDF